MRINHNREKRKKEKYKRDYNWHKWFAWYPVSFDENTLVWLEYLERTKCKDFLPFSNKIIVRWYYREITK